jgi:hypothetical protein
MSEQNTCATCGEAIGFFDKPVRMVQQVDVTTMNPAGQRQWRDGLVSTFHEQCAPDIQAGSWRRVA